MTTTSYANPATMHALGTDLPGSPSARTRGPQDVETPPLVIVNADDWGRDASTTDRTLDCHLHGAISSASAMVFMEDSERAAHLAQQYGLDTGLHLNFTLPFSARPRSRQLADFQEQIGRFLASSRFAPILFHRRLAGAFEYVVRAQMEEYERLYAKPAARIDGHHHMHLARNVLVQKLLPEGILVRRNLSFAKGEKGLLNRFYRGRQDAALGRRHLTTDYFFDLQPVEPRERLRKICALAADFNIEIETHPIRDAEYRFLVGGDLLRCGERIAIARTYSLNGRAPAGEVRRSAALQQLGRSTQ